MAVTLATQSVPFTKVTCKTERSMVSAEKKLWSGAVEKTKYIDRSLCGEAHRTVNILE